MKQPVLTSYDLADPRVVAFSTTRQGGFSQGPYGEFNINRYCGDDELSVSRNRALLCSQLGIADDRLLMPHQTHQTQVLAVDEPFLRLSESERRERMEGVDALMTHVEGLCIGVSTADLAAKLPGAIYCPTLAKVTETLRSLAQPGDLILTVGAGDIYKAGENLLKEDA